MGVLAEEQQEHLQVIKALRAKGFMAIVRASSAFSIEGREANRAAHAANRKFAALMDENRQLKQKLKHAESQLKDANKGLLTNKELLDLHN